MEEKLTWLDAIWYKMHYNNEIESSTIFFFLEVNFLNRHVKLHNNSLLKYIQKDSFTLQYI